MRHLQQPDVEATAPADAASLHKDLQISLCEKLELVWQGLDVDEAFLEATLRRCIASAAAHKLQIAAEHGGLGVLHWAVLADRASVITALEAGVKHLVKWDMLTRSADVFGAATALCLAAVLSRQAAIEALLRAGASSGVAWQQLDPDQKSLALVGLTPLHVVRPFVPRHMRWSSRCSINQPAASE